MSPVKMIEIGPDEVGIVYKRIGTPLPPGQLIALNDERGWQADLEPPGMCIYSPLVKKIHVVKQITIRQGEIGLVIANDGRPISPASGRVLGRMVECNQFQDARAFLEHGGEKGRQLGILTPSTYKINTELFTVITSDNATQQGMKPEQLRVCTIAPGNIGIVTTHDGKSLPVGEIAGPVIQRHNNFQDPQWFVDHGGCKGLQEEILPASTWLLNPWFAEVKPVPLTEIQTGTVGVVISNVGKIPAQPGKQLVDDDCKGIRKRVLPTGKYPINTDVMDVIMVPTHEIILSWSDKQKPETNYDSSLQSLKLWSRDAFPFSIELTQVISITDEEAPTMISRVVSEGTKVAELTASPQSAKFSSIKNLVTRVLGPLVDNHFRNSAQGSRALEFLENYVDRRNEAEAEIRAGLKKYGVKVIGTYINEIDLPVELRQIINEREILKQTAINYRSKLDLERINRDRCRAEAESDIQRDIVQREFELRMQQLKGQLRLDLLQSEISILGGIDNYIRKIRAENFHKLKLPHVLVDSQGNRGGLMNALMAGTFGNPEVQAPFYALPSADQLALPGTALPQLEPSLTRLPIVLLLDTADSMPSGYLDQLIQGIECFEQRLKQDETTRQCVEVAIITFGTTAKAIQNFAHPGEFNLSQIHLTGTPAIARGIEVALQTLKNRTKAYVREKLSYSQPWIILISGNPSDQSGQTVPSALQQELAEGQLFCLTIAVEERAMNSLKQILPSEVLVAKLDDLKFIPFFYGLVDQINRMVYQQNKECWLRGLAYTIDQVKEDLPPDQAQRLVDYFTKLTTEASKEQAERSEYHPNAAGLYRAAQTIGEPGETIQKLLPYLTKVVKFSD